MERKTLYDWEKTPEWSGCFDIDAQCDIGYRLYNIKKTPHCSNHYAETAPNSVCSDCFCLNDSGNCSLDPDNSVNLLKSFNPNQRDSDHNFKDVYIYDIQPYQRGDFVRILNPFLKLKSLEDRTEGSTCRSIESSPCLDDFLGDDCWNKIADENITIKASIIDIIEGDVLSKTGCNDHYLTQPIADDKDHYDWTRYHLYENGILVYEKDQRLNERDYGDLVGLNKAETADKYGDEQVLIWRRSYAIPPPELDINDDRHPRFDSLYSKVDPKDLPASECLKDTVDRFIPYWDEFIRPDVKNGKRVLIVAHGNSLRALVKYIDKISDNDILKLNIPTGTPLVYNLDGSLKPIKKYYLGDEHAISKKISAVANQGKSN